MPLPDYPEMVQPMPIPQSVTVSAATERHPGLDGEEVETQWVVVRVDSPQGSTLVWMRPEACDKFAADLCNIAHGAMPGKLQPVTKKLVTPGNGRG